MTSWNGNIFCVTGLFAGNSPVTGNFPSQMPMMWNVDVFFDLRLNKRLSKQSILRWFETPSRSLWRHCNEGWIIYFAILSPEQTAGIFTWRRVNRIPWRHKASLCVNESRISLWLKSPSIYPLLCLNTPGESLTALVYPNIWHGMKRL